MHSSMYGAFCGVPVFLSSQTRWSSLAQELEGIRALLQIFDVCKGLEEEASALCVHAPVCLRSSARGRAASVKPFLLAFKLDWALAEIAGCSIDPMGGRG